ncbi:TCP-1/cpn60 chaperonin family protein [Candidatus Woesearchaeota archaeon]|nr:TCP-1/cpn60 chaperonin family protein [Candidatus Woesearchaeota archaeon]
MANNNVQPIFILPEGTTKASGMNAQKINIEAAKQVADQVRSTLGPKGMDKMIVDALGDVIITNDGVTILQEMTIEHPSAKMIVEVAKTQEDEVGDGTTTVVVLAGELLKNALPLLEKGIHPTVIAKGYRIAANKALEILNSDIAKPITVKDKMTLAKIAETAMTGKGAENSKEMLSQLAVKAILDVAEDDVVDISNIKVEKKVGGSIEESQLVEGVIIDKERVHSGMPRNVENAKVALVNTPLEIKNTEIDAKIQITDPMQMQAFLDQEEAMIKKMVSKVVNSGANVIFCQKGIDDLAQHYLAKEGIFAARRVKESDMGKLARATGAKIINNLEDLSKEDLGHAGNVQEVRIADENMIYVQKCKNPKSVTILVRGGTSHVAEEVKRAMDDALGDLAATLNIGKVVAGAGSPEIELAMKLKKFSESLSGREQLAVEAFAESLEVIPRTLAENAGLDPIDIVAALKSAHDQKQITYGIDVFSGKVKDAWKMGVIEPLKIKTQAVSSSAEVAIMILRIDDVISGGSSVPDRDQGSMGGMMPPGM